MAVLLAEREADMQLWTERGGGPTLDDVLSGAWEGLAAPSAVACPVCGGDLAPRWSAGSGVVGGRCADCGSSLA
jgi:hypothetical protein